MFALCKSRTVLLKARNKKLARQAAVLIHSESERNSEIRKKKLSIFNEANLVLCSRIVRLNIFSRTGSG